jgi:anthranilate phosphoribosyltransferase
MISKEGHIMKAALQKVVRGEDLTAEEMEITMTRILDGKASSSLIGSLISALRIKGETIPEIAGAVKALRAKIPHFELDNHLLNMDRDDINFEDETIIEVGKRGDHGTRIFNVSAATTFVVAGGGLRVARHGNRQASRFLGTADVLECMGINLDISPSDVERSIREIGIGFMFAPVFQSPMKHVAKLREEVGIRTIFNLIGPLANPAGAGAHVLGVYEDTLTEKIAGAIKAVGGKDALVFHGAETIDELSVCGTSKLSRLHSDGIETFHMEPEDYGISRVGKEALQGGTIRENAEIVHSVLAGGKGPKRDIVVLNSAAAFWVSGIDETMEKGIERAALVIDSGEAKQKLAQMIRFTKECVPFTYDRLSNAEEATG